MFVLTWLQKRRNLRHTIKFNGRGPGLNHRMGLGFCADEIEREKTKVEGAHVVILPVLHH